MTPFVVPRVLENLVERDVWVLYHVLVQDSAWSLLHQTNVYTPRLITRILITCMLAHVHFQHVLGHALTRVLQMTVLKRDRIAQYIQKKMQHIVQVQQDVQRVGPSYQNPTYADLYSMSQQERTIVQDHLHKLHLQRWKMLCCS